MPVAPLRVSSLTFNSGDVVPTRDADIVVLVGPNNSGKSRTLQEIYGRVTYHPQTIRPTGDSFVLGSVELSKDLQSDSLAAWLEENRYTWVSPHDSQARFRTTNAPETIFAAVPALWASTDERLGELGMHLFRALWCGERLNSVGAAPRPDPTVHPEHPMHYLLRQPDLIEDFASRFKEAFGQNLIIDGWGSSIQLRISSDQVQSDFAYSSCDGLPNSEILARVRRLPTIETQSDGVRSFAGILLHLLSGQYPVVLLDEPEAFLHPPQARILGRSLADLQRDGQLFVATHSLDVVLGLIESRPERVLIVRLTRDGGTTSARVLPPARLQELWRDPLLRFSRALDGLFHTGVIVCEGDTDTQFYSAVAEREHAQSHHGGALMFTYAGDKHRIPMVTSALRAVGVPVRAVADFDVLREEATVKRLVTALDGNYSEEMARDWRVLDAALRGQQVSVTRARALEEITTILSADPDLPIDGPTGLAVRDATQNRAGWVAAKKSGLAAVPSGDPTVSAERLLKALGGIGLWIVPSGAVESFVKAVGGKGPRWSVEVVQGGYVETATDAHAFMQNVIQSLLRQSEPSAA